MQYQATSRSATNHSRRELPSVEENHTLLQGRKDSANSTVMQTLRPPSETNSRSPIRQSFDVPDDTPARPASTL